MQIKLIFCELKILYAILIILKETFIYNIIEYELTIIDSFLVNNQIINHTLTVFVLQFDFYWRNWIKTKFNTCIVFEWTYLLCYLPYYLVIHLCLFDNTIVCQ